MIDHLFSIFEEIPVDTLITLDPLELELVTLLQQSFVAAGSQNTFDSTRTTNEDVREKERRRRIELQFGVISLSNVAFGRWFGVE